MVGYTKKQTKKTLTNRQTEITTNVYIIKRDLEQSIEICMYVCYQ